jgi:Flp pilus assembly protein TadG
MLFLRRAALSFAAYCRCDQGATALEFIMIAPVLIVMLLATLQVSVIFFAQSNLEYVTEEGMRLVLTNQANGVTQTAFNTDICNKVIALFNCSNIIVSIQPAPTCSGTETQCLATMAAAMPQFDTNGNLVSTSVQFSIPSATSTGQEPVMMLVVMYEWPLISGPFGFNFGNLANGNYLLTSTQVFQIEPQS